MTGFGEARHEQPGVRVAAEIRTINNRYFKLTLKCGEGYSALETDVEALVRKHVRRGTVQVNLRVDRTSDSDLYAIDARVVESYRRQLAALDGGKSADVPVAALLALPGVVVESFAHSEAAQDWPAIEKALLAALDRLGAMRLDEGRTMEADLLENCRTISTQLDDIETRAPLVIEGYRARLEERLSKLLAERGLELSAADVIKEVSIFAERSDISEEIVRLRSHVNQFHEIMRLEESSGRKLDFLTQEMFRETNTIGSKSNDVTIARRVIEIKAAIERMREMIQNVE